MGRIMIDGVEAIWEEGENYIQINDISENDLSRVWKTLVREYPGYELTFCFRDVLVPADALAAIGAEVLEDCIAMKVTQQEYKPHNNPNITLLDREDFAEFAELHNAIYPEDSDMYWTSRRLWDRWDIWRIHVLRECSEIVGYSMMMLSPSDESLSEIFAVEASNSDHRKALFSAAAGYSFDIKRSVVLHMADRDNPLEHEATLAVGFVETGFYIGYIVRCIK
ncbi:MAG: hypothetical protein FWE11_02920 [Defluviitaleaceae bacterium]|nr:hypothetical protein [Defluviitaleaceae bacterium]